MHEASITQAMLDMALEYAQGQRITDIYLQVGKISLVVPECVEFYFEFLSKGTLAEGAKLHFEIVPIEITCLDCGRQADLSDLTDEPPRAIVVEALARGCQCGSKNLRVTGGMDFNMISLEVLEAGSKKQEARGRKQEARGRRQEARNKKRRGSND
jgi:hydrogenase nickel incorporation protein HypA/HybF